MRELPHCPIPASSSSPRRSRRATRSFPSPAAAIAALVASGLPTREFTFVGFPEKKSGARRRELERLLAEGRTIVVYESPYRVGDLLADLAAVAPDARVAVARELTKLHEEIV